MTGGFVHVAPDPALAHRCAPPERDVFMSPPPRDIDGTPIPAVPAKVGTRPDAPVGSVWACGCGRWWIVRWDDGRRDHGYTPAHAYWSPATWWERRRARRALTR